VAITFLQHTDGKLPHYSNAAWTFARGAASTIDRDFGFIDTHLFHDIIGTHVCHHLVSTIPFYHAGEASHAIRRVMGRHYQSDMRTGFLAAFWHNIRACKFVEESVPGSGVFFFRKLSGVGLPPAPAEPDRRDHLEASSIMASGCNLNAKRRPSVNRLGVALPLLAD
jgi:omega-6 fatty acid desaturase (delta-12 desaturase)